MSDLENQEFRECAELLADSVMYKDAPNKGIVIDLLAMAMRIAAEEAQANGADDEHFLPEEIGFELPSMAQVASRISSRIKGEK